MNFPKEEIMERTHSAVAAEPEEFWQANQVAQHTGIPEGTIRYWVHVGYGPKSFKLGRRRVWRRSVVEAWLAEQESAA